jgi:hypothetical protein
MYRSLSCFFQGKPEPEFLILRSDSQLFWKGLMFGNFEREKLIFSIERAFVSGPKVGRNHHENRNQHVKKQIVLFHFL